MTTVEGAVDDTATAAGPTRSLGSRLRSWLDEPRISVASMSSGQRYTAVLALALAVAMVTIGVPKEGTTDTGEFGTTTESALTYEPGPAPPTTMAPPAAMPSFAAEPPAFVEPATTTTMAPAPYEAPAPPPPSEPPPSSTTTTTAPPASPLPVPIPIP